MKLLIRSCFLILLTSALLAPFASAEVTLVVCDTGTSALHELDPSSGLATFIGNFGVGGYMAGLAYDSDADILYGSTSNTGMLFSIDPATGAATEIGACGYPAMHGLAFDSESGDLYASFGVDTQNNLYRVDPATGSATYVGAIGFFTGNSRDVVGGLSFHPLTGVLYGCLSGPSGTGALVTINTSTGDGTLVGYTQAMNGLAFHPETHVLYGVNNGSSGTSETLWTVNIDNGSVSAVGSVGLSNPLGLSFVSSDTATETSSWGAVKALFD